MNPDMKVYLTTITIDGTHDWVKPGMSVKVEILVNKLENCVYVRCKPFHPTAANRSVLFLTVSSRSGARCRSASSNDEFIEVKSGISEGERVLLRPPDGLEPQKPGKDQKEKNPGKK